MSRNRAKRKRSSSTSEESFLMNNASRRSPAFVDHYAVLGVSPHARTGELTAAFERKAAMCKASTVPRNARAQALATAQAERVVNAKAVLSDAARRAAFDAARRAQEAEFRASVEKRDCDERGRPVLSFGGFEPARARPAQPPPRGKWNQLRADDPTFAVWAKVRDGCGEVVNEARALATVVRDLEEKARFKHRVPKGNRKGDSSARDWWDALKLLNEILVYAGGLYATMRKTYETARDQEPFRVHLRLRLCVDQLDDLEGRLFDTREWLYPLVQRLDVFGSFLVEWDKKWEKTCCDGMAEAVRVWRDMKDLPVSISADKIDEIFGMKYAGAAATFGRFRESGSSADSWETELEDFMSGGDEKNEEQ